MYQSPAERSGRNGAGKLKVLTEVISGLQQPAMAILPLPLRTYYRDLRTIDEKRWKEIMNIGSVHHVLEQMRKEINGYNRSRQTRAHKIHNMRINVLRLNIDKGDYVMGRTRSKRNQHLQTKWRGPMRVKEAKTNLVFVLEDIKTQGCLLPTPNA